MLDWSSINHSILGMLFERGLDPDKRSQLGAHYTDRDKIMRIADPVIVRPLLAEWKTAKARIAENLERARSAKSQGAATRHRGRAKNELGAFLECCGAHRARPHLRLGELPVSGASRPPRLGTPGAVGGRGHGARTRLPVDQSRQYEGDRGERLRG